MSDAIEAARRIVEWADAPLTAWERYGKPLENVVSPEDVIDVSRALLSAVEGKGRETCDAVAPPILTSDAIDGIVHLVGLDVAELPDRTTPDDMPDMMLVTGDELEDIVRSALQAFLAYAPALASPSTEGWRDGEEGKLCSDCPPEAYPDAPTRCLPCPRRRKDR